VCVLCMQVRRRFHSRIIACTRAAHGDLLDSICGCRRLAGLSEGVRKLPHSQAAMQSGLVRACLANMRSVCVADLVVTFFGGKRCGGFKRSTRCWREASCLSGFCLRASERLGVVCGGWCVHGARVTHTQAHRRGSLLLLAIHHPSYIYLSLLFPARSTRTLAPSLCRTPASRTFL